MRVMDLVQLADVSADVYRRETDSQFHKFMFWTTL